MDILNKIKKQAYVKIIISESDYPSIKEVDQKLIQLAKEINCSIITNDFNLNKVAEVHSIQVLNINQWLMRYQTNSASWRNNESPGNQRR